MTFAKNHNAGPAEHPTTVGQMILFLPQRVNRKFGLYPVWRRPLNRSDCEIGVLASSPAVERLGHPRIPSFAQLPAAMLW